MSVNGGNSVEIAADRFHSFFYGHKYEKPDHPVQVFSYLGIDQLCHWPDCGDEKHLFLFVWFNIFIYKIQW